MYNSLKYKSTHPEDQQIFTLHRRKDIVFGIYKGGSVRFGTILGTVDKFMNLDFVYQEVLNNDKMISGKGFMRPSIKNPKILDLFKSSSLRSNKRTRLYLSPI